MAFSWVPLNSLNPNCSSNAFNNSARLTELFLAVVASSASQTFAYDLKHALTHGHGVLQLGGYWNTQGHAQHIDITGITVVARNRKRLGLHSAHKTGPN